MSKIDASAQTCKHRSNSFIPAYKGQWIKCTISSLANKAVHIFQQSDIAIKEQQARHLIATAFGFTNYDSMLNPRKKNKGQTPWVPLYLADEASDQSPSIAKMNCCSDLIQTDLLTDKISEQFSLSKIAALGLSVQLERVIIESGLKIDLLRLQWDKRYHESKHAVFKSLLHPEHNTVKGYEPLVHDEQPPFSPSRISIALVNGLIKPLPFEDNDSAFDNLCRFSYISRNQILNCLSDLASRDAVYISEFNEKFMDQDSISYRNGRPSHGALSLGFTLLAPNILGMITAYQFFCSYNCSTFTRNDNDNDNDKPESELGNWDLMVYKRDLPSRDITASLGMELEGLPTVRFEKVLEDIVIRRNNYH